jgi:predicted AAA+ superfamily ATPase
LQAVPAWSSNLGKRLIKSLKMYISDLNLLAYLLNVNLETLLRDNSMLFGAAFENFVAIEVTKQRTFSKTSANLYHYRTASGQEIDFILEGPNNDIVGIEVKAKSKISASDFHHLEMLQNEIGEKFRRGVVLYQGTE